MKSNSINNNGNSVCGQGEENYISFYLTHRREQTFYQYDYRYMDGDLFSTVASTLDECRRRRDLWLGNKNKKYKLFIGLKKIGEFNSILEAKLFANNSEYAGAFNLLGENYRDSWYIPFDSVKQKHNTKE